MRLISARLPVSSACRFEGSLETPNLWLDDMLLVLFCDVYDRVVLVDVDEGCRLKVAAKRLWVDCCKGLDSFDLELSGMC